MCPWQQQLIVPLMTWGSIALMVGACKHVAEDLHFRGSKMQLAASVWSKWIKIAVLEAAITSEKLFPFLAKASETVIPILPHCKRTTPYD